NRFLKREDQSARPDQARAHSSISPGGYFQRLAGRQSRQDRKRQIVFGLVTGGALSVASGLRWNAGRHEMASIGLLALGVSVLLVMVLRPGLLAVPERGLRRVTSALGSVILRTALLLSYLLAFVPLGLITQVLRGTRPFFTWEEERPHL